MAYELNLRELKTVTDAIFEHIINELKIDTVTLEDSKNFYWEVPTNELYSVREAQPQLDMGSHRDDWEFLQAIVDDKEQAVALMLKHVAPLLRLVGEKIGQ